MTCIHTTASDCNKKSSYSCEGGNDMLICSQLYYLWYITKAGGYKLSIFLTTIGVTYELRN